MSLTIDQRKKLKSAAHHLKPVVQVGRKGMTETLISAVDSALLDHELIKIKFIDYKEERKELSIRIANETGSEIVGIIGNIVIMFRQKEEKK